VRRRFWNVPVTFPHSPGLKPKTHASWASAQPVSVLKKDLRLIPSNERPWVEGRGACCIDQRGAGRGRCSFMQSCSPRCPPSCLRLCLQHRRLQSLRYRRAAGLPRVGHRSRSPAPTSRELPMSASVQIPPPTSQSSTQRRSLQPVRPAQPWSRWLSRPPTGPAHRALTTISLT
jgi:hypothetical protein